MKKACVIGWPIAHSRSPIIHNYWLAKYGLEGLYEKRPVSQQELPDFLQNLGAHGYVGCNVTIPHKEAALQLIEHVDDVVRRTGSLNTVYLVGNKTHATSTDGEGFYQNLIAMVPGLSLQGKRAILIGAGGSAKAIIERLLRAEIGEICVMNRTSARIEDLKASFGSVIKNLPADHFVSESKSAALLINATSQGMAGQPKLDIDLLALPLDAVVADLVYVPLETDLLKAAKSRGLRTVGGLGMLLHQAVVGFEKWFGVRPEVTPELYNLVATDIEKRTPLMMLIGITGSIAMGKSEAARYLASLGFPVFDSDSAVHQLYDSEQGAELIRPLAPQAIVDGKVNRPRLSEVVLNNKQLLGELEKRVHAEIQKRRNAFVDEARIAGAKAAILDIPLLFETSAEKHLDKVIVVSAPADIQRARALARPGMTPERLDLILARQMSDAEKRSRADAIIDSSLTLSEMQKSLLTLFTNWRLIEHA